MSNKKYDCDGEKKNQLLTNTLFEHIYDVVRVSGTIIICHYRHFLDRLSCGKTDVRSTRLCDRVITGYDPAEWVASVRDKKNVLKTKPNTRPEFSHLVLWRGRLFFRVFRHLLFVHNLIGPLKRLCPRTVYRGRMRSR